MTKKEKLLDKLYNNQKNFDKKTFKQILTSFGFTIDTKSGKGSHIKYYHKDFPNVPIRVVNITDPIRPYHVKNLIADIKEVSK